MQGENKNRLDPGLKINPELSPARSSTSFDATPKSAIISVPSDWGMDTGSSSGWNRHSIEAQPMSSSSSSSSSNPIFSWGSPTNDIGSSRTPLFVPRDRPHSLASMSSEDPLGQSSSSSDDDVLDPDAANSPFQPYSGPHFSPFVPIGGERRGSVVFVPHHSRSTSEIHLGPDGEPGNGHGHHAEGFDFDDAGPPKFTRTYSAPLPNRVGFLRHPLSPLLPDTPGPSLPQRPGPLPRITSSTASSETITDVVTPLSTLSHELADSLQSAIQTLLHLSPPHLLDNAKEQYSGCTVQMPATSLTALLTSMRSLNYLSANVQGLCEALTAQKDDGLLSVQRKTEDFDIGELVQNVADLLSGQAAQAGVDLVLFHGDVGIKHVSVNGDAEGLIYLLSHILRQILLIARKGDIIEIGLQLIPQSPSLTPKVSLPLTAANVDKRRQEGEATLGETLSPLPSNGPEGPILCVFEIIHNINYQPDSTAATPKAEINPFARLAEEKEAVTPKLDTILCRRLLDQQRASLKKDVQPSSPLGSGMPRKAYELSVLLPRGHPLVEPVPLSAEEEAIRQPFVGVQLAREPTLQELSNFADSLRGKKVFLHASLGSLFARHLTSYLAAWGLDISHIPIEEEEPSPTTARLDSAHASSLGSSPVTETVSQLQNLTLGPKDTGRFIIVDDDVAVLRRELLKICADATLLKPKVSKRPTLGLRARSTPALRPAVNIRGKSPVLIHFTSIANYNQVRDIIASVFGPQWAARDGAFYHPEVMVIPKPVGPRRFLTALHTAVNQPMIDPTFSPIATTPRSPGGGYFWTGGRTPLGNEAPREGFFDSVAEEAGETFGPDSSKARSPLVEHPPLASDSQHPSERVTTPATEYFSAAARGQSSAASGIIVHSPDGRFGIHFEPPVRGERRASYSQRAPLEPRRPSSRRSSGIIQDVPSSVASPTASPQSARRQSTNTATSDGGGISRRSSIRSVRDDTPSERRRKTLPAAGEPLMMQGRQRSSTITRSKAVGGTPGTPLVTSPITATAPAPSKKKVKEEVVVPPINVLIVEDNPINQNILSMFLRKKKIKHQAAKDGEEAIAKWRTGGFHLILMDIQLPKMDGIQATKIIRDEEKHNNIGVYPSTPLGDVQRALGSGQSVPSAMRSSVIIVALTASSLHSDRVAALGAGCNDFLTKPVSLKWLEKKIVEWGCMQALIDFDGWKRWKGSDAQGDTKQGFSIGPQQAARGVADRLKIERKGGKSPARQMSQSSQASSSSVDINIHAPTPPLRPVDAASGLTETSDPAESLQEARKVLEQKEEREVRETAIKPTHPSVANSELVATPTPLTAITEKL